MILTRRIIGIWMVLIGMLALLPAVVLFNGGYRVGNQGVGIFGISFGFAHGGPMVTVGSRTAGVIVSAVAIGLCAGGVMVIRHSRKSIQ
jgi:hypothetical protein